MNDIVKAIADKNPGEEMLRYVQAKTYEYIGNIGNIGDTPYINRVTLCLSNLSTTKELFTVKIRLVKENILNEKQSSHYYNNNMH
jgi:hypothetical protein